MTNAQFVVEWNAAMKRLGVPSDAAVLRALDRELIRLSRPLKRRGVLRRRESSPIRPIHR
jgi:hypothetical protein